MNLSYSGQEQVSAPPAAVWAFVQDPEQVARCLPEVREVRVLDQRTADATVQVGLGLLRGQFKFRLELEPDQVQGLVRVRVQGGGLGSTVELNAQAGVVDQGNGATLLDWQGSAVLGGTVTRVGGRQLDSLAQRLIVRTFRTMAARINASSGTLA